MSGAKTFEARVSLEGRNGQIKGVEKIKFLGITLDRDCSFESHVQNLRTSVRRRSWALTKLKRRGMNNEQLKKVYTSMIRPSIEYASVAWHSMLTKEQANVLEGQQVQCLKKILGPGTSARRMRQVLQIEPLYERREKAVVKFGQKCLKSDRFRQWFPQRTIPPYERRANVSYRLFYEPTCRTERHKNSPLNYIRKKLNESV